ncbi:EAL domain-containing protein [Algibacillus agarilyticus]|uniref:EAL domain-containing protein n=1 Tax=Algibacillus agarilyticus TaxID=2234133 RepID=UPI000DCFAC0B|nr:EAL domain-containing protein [Algibacillus agarilyticus]
MKKLPLKTSVRAIRLWRNYIISALVGFLVIVWLSFVLIHAGERNSAIQAQINQIEKVQFNWPTLTHEAAQKNGLFQGINSLSYTTTELVYHFELSPISKLDWQSTYQINVTGGTITLSYAQVSAHFILKNLACLFLFSFILAVIVSIVSNTIESKFRKLERKARKLGIAKRRSEHIKYRSVVVLVDSLLDELAWNRKEQNRIDKFIRSQTFLDPELGIGNRLFFDHRFDAALVDEENSMGGAILLVHIQELDRIENEYGSEQAHQLLSQIIGVLNQTLRISPEPLLARRAYAEIAVLLQGVNEREIIKFADALVRSIQRVALPQSIESDSFFHIGIARFNCNDKAYQVLSEADMALRTAQLQGHVGWFMYENDAKPQELIMGSLKWRTFLENALAQESFTLYFQPILSAKDNAIHHQEATLRVRDAEGKLLQAGLFLPMAFKCGLQSKIEQQALKKLFNLFHQDSSSAESSSLNISIDSLLEPAFFTWLLDFLRANEQYCDRLILEFNEYNLFQQNERLQPIFLKLSRLGVRLLVDHVGQYVINSSYIKQHPIAYIKLHSSLIRNIEQHPENQLFIRSLLANCSGGNVRVFGYGIENADEWQQLKSLNIDGGQGVYLNHAINELSNFN